MPDHKSIHRVLMTADTVGGVWTYAMDLARGLREYGVEVALATMGGPVSPQQAWQAAQLDNLTLYESTYKLEWMEEPWAEVERAGDWLLTLENDLEPDIVHLNGYAHGNLPWNAPHIVAGHSCVLSWWWSVRGEPAPAEWTRYRSSVTAGLCGADFVVAPTRAMMAELQKYYGPLRSTAVIANGRAPQCYYADTKEPFILAAGRLWDEAKNIVALAKVKDAVDWPICVAGDARHPNGTTPKLGNIRQAGVLGQSELAALYSRAAIYCLPARYEPFGLSIVEAALSGCALVLGDIPSLRENWEGAAVFVAPGDTTALEWNLRDLIANPGCLRRLSSLAQSRARTFSVERMSSSYLGLYARLAGRRRPLAVAGD